MKGRPEIHTVLGITNSVKQLAIHFGVVPQTAHARLEIGWSIEQALGLAAPPPRRRQGGRVCHLPAGPPLASAEDNLWLAILTPMPAEEYLRREGIPPNGYPLTDKLPDEES